jgi:hypothetical protein
MPALAGTYFYADYCANFIKSLRIVSGSVTDQRDRTTELAPGGGLAINSVTTFGEDARGEIHIVDQGGEIYKILPVLRNLEVSGAGATAFLLSTGDWTWEDLQASSSHPIQSYQVFRSSGNGGGTFDCVHQGPGAVWVGGDPVTPSPAGLFSYLVTATNSAGERSSAGTRSDGTPRTLSALACP